MGGLGCDNMTYLLGCLLQGKPYQVLLQKICLERKITVFFPSPQRHQLDRKREEQELINWKGEGQAGIRNQAEDRETTRCRDTQLQSDYDVFTGSRNMFLILNAVPVSILHRVVENRAGLQSVMSRHSCHGYQHSTGNKSVKNIKFKNFIIGCIFAIGCMQKKTEAGRRRRWQEGEERRMGKEQRDHHLSLLLGRAMYRRGDFELA